MYIASYCMYVCIMWFTHEKKYFIQIKYYITISSLLATLLAILDTYQKSIIIIIIIKLVVYTARSLGQ